MAKRKLKPGATQALCERILEINRAYPGEIDAEMCVEPAEWEYLVMLAIQISGQPRGSKNGPAENLGSRKAAGRTA